MILSNDMASAMPISLLPLPLSIPVPQYLFGGTRPLLTLQTGITVLLGPNGTGKTQVMRGMQLELQAKLHSFPCNWAYPDCTLLSRRKKRAIRTSQGTFR